MPLQVARHRRGAWEGDMLAEAFVEAHKEGLVVADGSAQHAAEIIEAMPDSSDPVAVVLGRVRVKRVAAVEEKR